MSNRPIPPPPPRLDLIKVREGGDFPPWLDRLLIGICIAALVLIFLVFAVAFVRLLTVAV